MELHIKSIGALLIALSCIHFIFPKYFNWKDELARLSLINRQMMQVHTFFLALILLLMGLLCITSAQELTTTILGKKICIGLFLFWACRLIIQFWGYSSTLWKGKKFETIIHILFAAAWCYFTATFFLSAFYFS